MAVIRSFIQLDGSSGIKNPFPNAVYSSVFPAANTKNTYAKGTRESIAFDANFNAGSGLGGGIARRRAETQLRELTQAQQQASVQQQVQQQIQPQQIAKVAPKIETPGTGANRGAVGSLGTSSGAGVAGNAQAGLLGSVNTEVQNDDTLLPYQKV